MSADAKLKAMGIDLPTPPKPVAKYKPTVRVGNMLYVSGHGPAKIGDKSPIMGRVGAELTLEPVSYTHLDVYKRQAWP